VALATSTFIRDGGRNLVQGDWHDYHLFLQRGTSTYSGHNIVSENKTLKLASEGERGGTSTVDFNLKRGQPAPGCLSASLHGEGMKDLWDTSRCRGSASAMGKHLFNRLTPKTRPTPDNSTCIGPCWFDTGKPLGPSTGPKTAPLPQPPLGGFPAQRFAAPTISAK